MLFIGRCSAHAHNFTHTFQEQIDEKKRYTQSLEQQLEQRSVLLCDVQFVLNSLFSARLPSMKTV